MCSTPNDDVVDAEFAAIPADPLDYIPGLDVDNIKYDDLSHVGDEEVLDDAAAIVNGSDDPVYEQQHVKDTMEWMGKFVCTCSSEKPCFDTACEMDLKWNSSRLWARNKLIITQ